MDFYAEEDRDGVRFSWNMWPCSRLEATRVVVPVGCLYTPLKETTSLGVVNYEPVMCKGCTCLLNPFCSVDFGGKLWVCPFCFQRNQFPQHYAGISETNLPAELLANYTTMEYILPRNPVPPPIFLFVVDTCLIESELTALKEMLLMALSLLPEGAQVGLITFGTTVQVYELGFEACPKSFVFSGKKELTSEQVQQLLGFSPGKPDQRQPMYANPAQNQKRFVLPKLHCESNLENIIEELQADPYPVKSSQRPLRATGVACAVAVGIMETFTGMPGRLMLFIGGPCTLGPGMVVGPEKKEFIRAHHDIIKDNAVAKYLSKAQKYYSQLAGRLAKSGHAFDIFSASGDQTGVLEMQDFVKATGGLIVQPESFESPIFKDSLAKVFRRDASGKLKMGLKSTLDIRTSRELKVCGAIGHCSSLGKTGPSVADTEIGIGGTTAWSMGHIDPASTYAFFFEVVNTNQNPPPAGSRGMLQFQTHYVNSLGQSVLRVTTLSRGWTDTTEGLHQLTVSFDQEAAAVLMARIAVFKAETEDSFDILRWLDRMLIRLVNKFADYRKDDPSSFSLHQNFSIYPQFMFHLRRGSLLSVFNNSPDETAFIRFMLNRETTTSCLTMIQPTLDMYSFDGPPRPVLLSASSVQPDKILLLDTFFHVVIFCGETIADWRNQGYQNDPNYASFKQLLQAPRDDAEAILAERFPLPRFIECDQGTGEQRFLLSVLDPSVTHQSIGQQQGQVIFTEDVNLEVFMEHLKKLAVQSS